MNGSTNVCPQCSTSLPSGAVFCGECGHSVGGSAPAKPAAPSPTAAPLPAQAGSSLPKALGAVLAVGGLVALGAWGWLATRSDDGAKSASAVAAAPPQVTVTQVVTPPAGQSTPAAPQESGAAALSNTVPGPAIAPSDSWILVFDSLEQSRYSVDEAEARSNNVSGSTMVVDSSQTPGLRSGYWAVVSADWYPTKEAAESACAQHGRPVSGSCYGRRIG